MFQVYSKLVHLYIIYTFQILFPYRLLQDIEYCSLCYIVGPHCFILYMVACVC